MKYCDCNHQDQNDSKLHLAVWVIALVVFLTLMPQVCAANAGARADHLLIISIDGLRPEFYQDVSWPAPTLQQLAAEGSYAKAVKPAFPSVTYPNHTTIVTGAWPSLHGIYYNSPFEHEGETGAWYWHAKDIQVPTLWQALANNDVSVAVGWPVTVGADIDYNLPEYWRSGRFEDFIKPLRSVTTPTDLLKRIETEATGKWTDERVSSDYPRRDLLTANAAGWLFKEYRPKLLLWHAIAVDHFQHIEGRDGPGVRQALAAVDTGIGYLIDHIRKVGALDRTAIIITGDHGFHERHTRLAPNTLLKQAGLLGNHRKRGRWRAAFHCAGASAFLHLQDMSDKASYREVLAVIDALPLAHQALFKVLKKDQLTALHSAPEAVLALAPKPGVEFTCNSDQPWLSATQGGQHGYLVDHPQMYTGMLVWGAGVRPGVRLEMINITDIAPLAAALLDIEFTAPDGVLPIGVLSNAR